MLRTYHQTFGVILPPNPHGKISINSQIIPVTTNENNSLNYVLSKYY